MFNRSGGDKKKKKKNCGDTRKKIRKKNKEKKERKKKKKKKEKKKEKKIIKCKLKKIFFTKISFPIILLGININKTDYVKLCFKANLIGL